MRLIIGGAYQGRKKYALNQYGADKSICYLSYDLIDGKGLEAILDKAMQADICIADEAYRGLTPIDAKEKSIMESYGRLLEEVAKNADSVERVVCGLAITLK